LWSRKHQNGTTIPDDGLGVILNDLEKKGGRAHLPPFLKEEPWEDLEVDVNPTSTGSAVSKIA